MMPSGVPAVVPPHFWPTLSQSMMVCHTWPARSLSLMVACRPALLVRFIGKPKTAGGLDSGCAGSPVPGGGAKGASGCVDQRPAGGKMGARRNMPATSPGCCSAYGPMTNEAADQPMKETFSLLHRALMNLTTVASSSHSLWELPSWCG